MQRINAFDCFIQTLNQMKSAAWLQQMWRHLDCCDCWWSIASCCVTQRDTAWQSWRVARGTKTDGLHTPAPGRGRGQWNRRHNGTNLMSRHQTQNLFRTWCLWLRKRFEGGFPSLHTNSHVDTVRKWINWDVKICPVYIPLAPVYTPVDRQSSWGKWFISPVRKRENCCKNFWS